MSERLGASLAVLGELDQGQRLVLVGSMARAAVLGDAGFSAQTGKVDRDVDIIDTTGVIREKFAFRDAAPIDGLMTRTLRPAEAGVWGLYDVHGSDENKPEVTIDEELLGIHTTELPFAPGASFRTFNTCAHMVLRNIYGNIDGKHRRQYRALNGEQHAAQAVCSCHELRDAMSQYHQQLRAKDERAMSERAYARARAVVRMTAPNTFRRLQASSLGLVVRQARGTAHKVDGVSIYDVPELTTWAVGLAGIIAAG